MNIEGWKDGIIRTETEQQAIALLASGKTVNQTAQTLGVHYTTVWQLRQQAGFQAYENLRLKEAQTLIRERMITLVEDATNALWEVVRHGTPQASLNTAVYIIEFVQKMEAGATDPRELIREQCRGDEEAYRQRCNESGIEP